MKVQSTPDRTSFGRKALVLATSFLSVALSAPFAFSAESTYSATVAPETPPAPAWINEVKVQPDKAPDTTSLKSIVDSVTRGCESNDQKAIAIYNFMILTHYHQPYPTEAGGLPSLKEINCYGWSLCGGLHTVESALWRAAGWNWRYVGWSNPGHTTVEAEYDGKWHYLDAFLKFYAWMPDGNGGRTIAGEDDIAASPEELITNGFVLDKGRGCVYAKDEQFIMNGDHAVWRTPAFLTCGDPLEGVISGVKSRSRAGSPEGWAGLIHSNGKYNTDLALAPGVALTNGWEPVAGDFYYNDGAKMPFHSCSGYKDQRNDAAYGLILEPYITKTPAEGLKAARSYGTGTLSFSPDFSNDAFLKSFTSVDNAKYENKSLVPVDPSKPASVVIPLQSPYIFAAASGIATGADSVEVSVDQGKTFKKADLNELGNALKVKHAGNTSALVKIIFSHPLTDLKLDAFVQNNPGALPYLSPGKNKVAVSVENPAALGDNKLVVTYAYQLGSRTKSPEQLCDQGKDIADGPGSNATWSDAITYVQKSFSAKDLPASFEVDCPTPKGKHPVYPRMLFLRREVIAPGSSPLPLPQGAVEAKMGDGDELLELPNPFLIGTENPEPIKVRPVKTIQVPIEYIQFCNDKGEVQDKGSMNWSKNKAPSGTGAYTAVLLNGDLKELPKTDLAAARLVVPIISGTAASKAKLGVVFLKTPIEKGKPCDFAELNATAGIVILPKQPEATPAYEPAKMVSIDLTRPIKAVASGEAKFNGFALRLVPDKGTDEGYSIHCQVSPSVKPYLEYDVYTDDPSTPAVTPAAAAQ